jgi:hypothetical protein
MKDCKNFEHRASKEEFDKLADFMEQNNFSCSDFFSVRMCSHCTFASKRVYYRADGCRL